MSLADGSRKICGIPARLALAFVPFTNAVILGYGINIACRLGLFPPQATVPAGRREMSRRELTPAARPRFSQRSSLPR